MKYIRDNRNLFYSGLKTCVNQYFKDTASFTHGDYRVYIKGIILIMVYVSSYASIFHEDSTFLSLSASYIILGLSGVMIVFNIVHDASHNALFKKKRFNDYARYLGDLVGINTYIWDIRHNVQHHSFTNVLGGDLIIENIPLIRLSPHQQYKVFHRYQLFYAPLLYMFYSFYWIVIIDFNLFMRKEICNLKNIKHPPIEWATLLFFKLFYLTYSLLLPWLLTPLSFLEALGFFMLMHMVAGLLLSIVAVLGHFVDGPSFPKVENGLIDNSWSEHELEATIDFAPASRIVNWITGGLNTHVAHHLFPKMSHVHYYEVTPIIEAYCQANGYPYKKETLPGAISSHVRYLRKLSHP
jgi:linoleoyl-CoA desaturase